MNKKKLLIIFIANLLFFELALASSLQWEFSLPNEVAGDGTAEIKVKITQDPKEQVDHISLFIKKAGSPVIPINQYNLCEDVASEANDFHLHKIFDCPQDKPVCEGSYFWKPESGPGVSQVVAVVMKSSRYTKCRRENILSFQSKSITVTSAPSGTGGGTGNGTEGGTGTGGGTGGLQFPKITIPRPGTGTGTVGTPLPENDWLAVLLMRVLRQLLLIANGLAVIAMIYSGILYITSSGNPQIAEMAKKNLIWAIIAVAIISGAVGVIRFLEGFAQVVFRGG